MNSATDFPLLVFSDDWGRHPSSCQHLVRNFLARRHVCWVNTIGMRRPRWDRATLVRAWEKLRQWFLPRRAEGPLPEGLTVLNPRMWPWFTRPFDRRLNRRLLLRELRPVLELAPAPVVAVTTLPVVADLTEDLPVARWVYYCVDDFSQWPGLDHAVLLEMEGLLVRRADVLIAVSTTLQDRIARWGRAAALLTHGVDLEHWRGAEDRIPEGDSPISAARKSGQSPLPPGLERPLVVFWGLIDRRMDAGFLARLAGDLDRGTIVLVGPEDDPDPALAQLPRLRRFPPVPYERLPALAREAAVLVMPYADLPVTRAMQPLKLTEYLATGRPVVARRLPSTQAWSDALDEAATAEEFSRAVRRRLAEGLPAPQAAARKRLEQESWAAKARVFEELAIQGAVGVEPFSRRTCWPGQ